MNEVGDKLKEARKAKGYTLDDLQQMTKIQKRYLIAVEEGNLDVLPGNFYARAFIKQYADTVGLNGEQLLKEHTDNIPVAKDDEYTEKVKSTQTRSKARQGGFWTTFQDSLPTILIVLLVVAIAGAIYIAWINNSDGNETDPIISEDGTEEVEVDNNDTNEGSEPDVDEGSDPNDDESSADDEEDPESEDEPTEEQTLEISSSTGSATVYTVSGTHPEEQSLVLSAQGGDSWVSITVDSQTVEQALLSDGQSLEANFGPDVSQVDVVIGNATATEVQLNGEVVEYAEESASIVRQDLQFNFE